MSRDVSGYGIGDTIRLTCSPGYRLVGPSVLLCTDEGWDQEEGHCEPVSASTGESPVYLHEGTAAVFVKVLAIYQTSICKNLSQALLDLLSLMFTNHCEGESEIQNRAVYNKVKLLIDIL